MESKKLLNYSSISDGTNSLPKAMLITTYHFILLYDKTLKVNVASI